MSQVPRRRSRFKRAVTCLKSEVYCSSATIENVTRCRFLFLIAIICVGIPVRAVLMFTGWNPPLSADESMMSESKSRWFFRYTKSATMTEMTKHMMTAMTIPTYRATSSVLGAAGERDRQTGL